MLVLVATVAAQSAGSHTSGRHESPWLARNGDVFRERAWTKRHQLADVKSDKCRPAPRFDRRPGEVVPTWRRHRLDRLAFRVERARGYSNRCVGDLSLNGYYAIPSWRRAAWSEIHGCEGSWTDTGDPYWGGLQMDDSFMRTYGLDAMKRWGGYAHLWPWWAQIVVADRAYRSGRGFNPWPTCARSAGYL